MTFGLPPVRLVADFRASAMGIKPKSPGSVATVSLYPVVSRIYCSNASPVESMTSVRLRSLRMRYKHIYTSEETTK